MPLHILKSAKLGGTYGFTADSTGANLPADMAPWNYVKSIDSNPGETPRIGVNTTQLLQDIEAQGWHIPA